jgi:hypothetical protein
MKCDVCGKNVPALFEGPNGEALCEECKTAADKAAEEAKKIVSINPDAPAENPVRCEVRIGVLKNGQLYFNAEGEGADLLVIDGLLKYAKRRMSQQWDIRDAQQIAAMREAQAQAEAGEAAAPSEGD